MNQAGYSPTVGEECNLHARQANERAGCQGTLLLNAAVSRLDRVSHANSESRGGWTTDRRQERSSYAPNRLGVDPSAGAASCLSC